MNRLIACMHTAHYMTDFKESVADVVTRPIARHMDYSVAQKKFRNFLHKHWQAGDVRKPELMKWFYSTWRFLTSQCTGTPHPQHGNQFGQPGQPVNFGRFSDWPWTLDSPPYTTHAPVQGIEKHCRLHEMGCWSPQRPHPLKEPHGFESAQMTQPGSTHKPAEMACNSLPYG